jgi:hypothetical protein
MEYITRTVHNYIIIVNLFNGTQTINIILTKNPYNNYLKCGIYTVWHQHHKMMNNY